MLNELIEMLRGAAQTQFGGGVILMSILGSAIAILRNTPRKLITLISRRVFVTVDVQDNNTLFDCLERWLDSLEQVKGSRLLSAKWQSGTVTFSPAPGNHFFWLERRPIWLNRDRQIKESGYPTEKFTIRMIGTDPSPVRTIIKKALNFAISQDSKPGIYVVRWNDWTRMGDVPKRPLDTVILPDRIKESLLEDVNRFLSSREWYEANGIPWRRGYLLEGLPGTGKTSLVTAVAYEKNINTYICNVGMTGLTDEKLMNLIYAIPHNSIVLMEDIDAVVAGRDVKATSTSAGVTFAGLLNCLDGLASNVGVLTFMTTNHVEKLDPALIRRGRMDYHVKFGYADQEQVVRYLQRYYPNEDPRYLHTVAEELEGKVIADIQHLVMANRNSIQNCMKAIENDKRNKSNSEPASA